jgi:importin subunit beta-1
MKQSVLSTLATPSAAVGSGAAQCVAAIAHVEFPAGKGIEMLQALLNFAQDIENPKLRVHTLQAIGYICEGMAPEVISSRSNDILTAVVQGARKEESNAEVQAAALQALYNSLEFISDNFEREGERNYIMQVLCEATQNVQERVQVLAFQNLVRIMSLYYDAMQFYMERALFGVSRNCEAWTNGSLRSTVCAQSRTMWRCRRSSSGRQRQRWRLTGCCRLKRYAIIPPHLPMFVTRGIDV